MIDKKCSDRLIDRRKPDCPAADKWVEQARMIEEKELSDDGRQKETCGNRKNEDPCTL